MNQNQLSQWQPRCDALIANQHSLLMATKSAAGDAEISVAPFVRHDGRFYVLVSELAQHTQNMLQHPQASLLFIEPETETKNPFARQRLTFRCSVAAVARDDADYPLRLAQMSERFGDTVALLDSLPDFHLMALTPLDGLFVAGFGKAMTVDGLGQLVTVTAS